MYNKNDLNEFSKALNFSRDNVEKVVRLIEILRLFTDTPELSNSLSLKGGTAINLLYNPLTRLSVDIDLDYAFNESKEGMLLARDVINKTIISRMERKGYVLSPRSKNPVSLDSWMFQYLNVGGNKDYIKIEINYSMRAHIQNPVFKPVIFPKILSFNVKTLDPIELYASKINAFIDRMAARDLYDVDGMIANRIIPMDSYSLLRKMVVFYNKVSGKNALSKDEIIRRILDIPFSVIKSDLLPMLHKGTYYDLALVKERVTDFISEWCVLTDSERQFIIEFDKGSYIPEYLFDDSEILCRIRQHPMALWRVCR